MGRPTKLLRGFLVQDDPEARLFEEVKANALIKNKIVLVEMGDVYFQPRGADCGKVPNEDEDTHWLYEQS